MEEFDLIIAINRDKDVPTLQGVLFFLFGDHNKGCSQCLLNQSNCAAGEVMTTAKPPCDIRWTTVGQNCQIFFADTLFFHYRIHTTGNTFRYGIGRPVKVGNTVIRLLYDRTINFDVGGRFHNSKETLSMPVMTFCSILILPLFSSCARSWSNFCRFITYPLNSASSSYVLVVLLLHSPLSISGQIFVSSTNAILWSLLIMLQDCP